MEYENVNKTDLKGFSVPKAELLKIQFSEILAMSASDICRCFGGMWCFYILGSSLPVNTAEHRG